MPVFVSYSHADKDFVDRLALQLVKARTPVWLDRWELNVGDSLLARIEAAVSGAAALVVVLSRASVASEWCRKELSAGLVRELSEKRVVVLPILTDDCAIPLFLQDKKYADFRLSFDEGLRDLRQAVAFITNDSRSRIETPEWHTDWAMDWGMEGAAARYTLTFVEQAVEHPYSCLVTIQVRGNSEATARYIAYADAGLEHVYRHIVVTSLEEAAAEFELRMLLDDQFPKHVEFGVHDSRLGIEWKADVECRLLGVDTGSDVLLDIAGMLRGVVVHMAESAVKVTPEDQRRLDSLLAQIRR